MESQNNKVKPEDIITILPQMRKRSSLFYGTLTKYLKENREVLNINVNQHRRLVRDFSCIVSTIATLSILLLNADILMKDINIIKSEKLFFAALFCLVLVIIGVFFILKQRIEKENKVLGIRQYQNEKILMKWRGHQATLNELSITPTNTELYKSAVDSEKELLNIAKAQIPELKEPTLDYTFDIVFGIFVLALILIMSSFFDWPNIWSKIIR